MTKQVGPSNFGPSHLDPASACHDQMRIAQAIEPCDLNKKLVDDKHKEMQMQSTLATTHKEGLKSAMQRMKALCDSRN